MQVSTLSFRQKQGSAWARVIKVKMLLSVVALPFPGDIQDLPPLQTPQGVGHPVAVYVNVLVNSKEGYPNATPARQKR